jgi:hypothetical protein
LSSPSLIIIRTVSSEPSLQAYHISIKNQIIKIHTYD